MKRTNQISRAGVIGALYIVVSLIILPLNSGAIQVRVSEGLCLLPLIYLEAVPALAVGCMVVNLITGCAVLDVVLGSLVTLLAGILTYLSGRLIKKCWVKIFVGGLFPVILNAFLLPLIWIYCYGAEYIYLIQTLLIFLGQAVSVYLFGVPTVLTIDKYRKRGVKFLE